MGLYTKNASVTTYWPIKVVAHIIKNSLNQLATSNYDLTLLNVIGNTKAAQVDTWSTLAIGLDFMMAAVTFFLVISALCIDDSSIQIFFEWGQV